MMITFKLINISITSHSYHFYYCGEKTFSKFPAHNTVSLTTVINCTIECPEFIHPA